MVSLQTIDDLWSEYLAGLAELRSGVQWVSLAGGGRDPIQEFYRFGGFDPFREYVKRVDALFEDLQLAIDSETPKRVENAETANIDPSRRGTTWTYITTDQPFGSWMQSALRDWLKKRTEEK